MHPDINTRTREQIRPVWRGDETFEQFVDVNNVAAEALTIPATATGLTIVHRNVSVLTGLFILPISSLITGPRILLNGGPSAKRRHYMALGEDNAPAVHLMAEAATGPDVDVFYHYD